MNVPICVVLVLDNVEAGIVTLPLLVASVFSPGSPLAEIGRVLVVVAELAPALGPGTTTMNVPS